LLLHIFIITFFMKKSAVLGEAEKMTS